VKVAIQMEKQKIEYTVMKNIDENNTNQEAAPASGLSGLIR
jgi:hypothetical protein